MKKRDRHPYIAGMMAGFGAISLSVVFFFILFRMNTIVASLSRILTVLQPITIGVIIAYLLRPICNTIEKFLKEKLPIKAKKKANAVAVTVSMIFALVLVYALIRLILPQLIISIRSLQKTLPSQLDNLML